LLEAGKAAEFDRVLDIRGMRFEADRIGKHPQRLPGLRQEVFVAEDRHPRQSGELVEERHD
jgi:hypothetical protein